MEITELRTDIFTKKVAESAETYNISSSFIEDCETNSSTSSWRRFRIEGSSLSPLADPVHDLSSKLRSFKPTREDAKLALNELNQLVPPHLSPPDLLLLPFKQSEAILWGILYRTYINLYLGNFEDAFADHILRYSLLDELGETSRGKGALSFHHLALGEKEKGLGELRELAGNTGEPLSYLLLKSLGHPLPPFSPSESPFSYETDTPFQKIDQLFREQRFEEAIGECDAFLTDRSPFSFPYLVPISNPSAIDPNLPIENWEHLVNESYFPILSMRGLCKAMLNDFAGAVEDYDQLFSFLPPEPSYYQWGDSIVKMTIRYPHLEERILERGFLHHLHGNSKQACADFDSLIPTFEPDEEEDLGSYGFAHFGNEIALLAAASKMILM